MNQPQTIIVEQRSNGIGTAGFVISLLGFLTCGLICPLGLLFSFFGLFGRPKGLAAAGFVLGAIGSAWLFLGGFVLLMGILGMGAAIDQEIDRIEQEVEQAQSELESASEEVGVEPDEEPSITSGIDSLSESVEEAEASPQIDAEPDLRPEPQLPEPEPEPELEWHTFSDKSGRYNVEAQFLSLGADTVTLKKRDGTTVKVKLTVLSEDDQKWIREQIRIRR